MSVIESPSKERAGGKAKPQGERKPIVRFSGFRLEIHSSPRAWFFSTLRPPSQLLLFLLAMVAARPSNERPRTAISTNAQPQRNSMYWSPYSNVTADDEPPMVPPKVPDPDPMYLSPVSTSFPPATYTRPRYTSFSVYEPQSASMAFPEPHPHRSASQRSVLGTIPPIRHKASMSDVGFGASRESLWRPNSNRGSYAATVCYSFCFLEHSMTPHPTSRNHPLQMRLVTPCMWNGV